MAQYPPKGPPTIWVPESWRRWWRAPLGRGMTFRAFLLTLVVLFVVGLALLFFVFLPRALYPETGGHHSFHPSGRT